MPENQEVKNDRVWMADRHKADACRHDVRLRSRKPALHELDGDTEDYDYSCIEESEDV